MESLVDHEAIIATAVDLLRDLASGWERENQAQRNELASLAFESVEIDSGRLVAIRPQPDIAQFLAIQIMGIEQRESCELPLAALRSGSQDSNLRSPP